MCILSTFSHLKLNGLLKFKKNLLVKKQKPTFNTRIYPQKCSMLRNTDILMPKTTTQDCTYFIFTRLVSLKMKLFTQNFFIHSKLEEIFHPFNAQQYNDHQYGVKFMSNIKIMC